MKKYIELLQNLMFYDTIPDEDKTTIEELIAYLQTKQKDLRI